MADTETQDESSELASLATRADNLYNAFYWEVAWKNNSLRTGHEYLTALLGNEMPRAGQICTQLMLELSAQAAKDLRRPPKILDVGCGPVSSLAHLVHEGLADVVGLDPLADEYSELLSRHGKESPVTQKVAYGEYLDEVVPDQSIDIAHIRNALDHTQSPCLTWLNIFRTVRTGGYLVQSHSIREATKEKWRQLHQFDLYPDEAGNMWLEDAFGTHVCLTATLPLQVVKKVVNLKDDGHGWMTVVYRKVDDDWKDANFLTICIKQMKAAFRKRSNHAMELERFIVKSLEALDSKQYPYKADITSRA